MPERLTGTVTFLFSDIEGSTRLLQQLRDPYDDVLSTQLKAAATGPSAPSVATSPRTPCRPASSPLALTITSVAVITRPRRRGDHEQVE
jgi:hypothetical protein